MQQTGDDEDLEQQISQLLSAVAASDNNYSEKQGLDNSLNQWPWNNEQSFINTNGSACKDVCPNNADVVSGHNGQELGSASSLISIDPDALRALQNCLCETQQVAASSAAGPFVDDGAAFPPLSVGADHSNNADLCENVRQPMAISLNKSSEPTAQWLSSPHISEEAMGMESGGAVSGTHPNQPVMQLNIPTNDAASVKLLIQLLADLRSIQANSSTAVDLNDLAEANPPSSLASCTEALSSQYQQLMSLAQLNNILSIPIEIVNEPGAVPVSEEKSSTSKQTSQRRQARSGSGRRRKTARGEQRTQNQHLSDKLKYLLERISSSTQTTGHDGLSFFDPNGGTVLNGTADLLGAALVSPAASSADRSDEANHVCMVPKFCRNKMVSAHPLIHTRSTMCKPVSFHRGTQTIAEELENDLPPGGIIPVPLAIHVPLPICLQRSLVPCFVPIPVPVPVPIFVPVSERNFDGLVNDSTSRLPQDCGEAAVIQYARKLAQTRACAGTTDPAKAVTSADCLDVAESLTRVVAAVEGDVENGSTLLKWMIGVRCLYTWLGQRRPKANVLDMSTAHLAVTLAEFVRQLRRPDGESYSAECLLYTCICLHYFFRLRNRPESIFFDDEFVEFNEILHESLKRHRITISTDGQVLSRITEELLWEAELLGAHSPHILLNTIFYFNTRFFLLKTVADHMSISFGDVRQHVKQMVNKSGEVIGESRCLRYYPIQDQQVIYEQSENVLDPFRCAVRLYEFYRSKCPAECVVGSSSRRTAPPDRCYFYLEPERSARPESPCWFSSKPLSSTCIDRMLTRLKLVKEITEAQLTVDSMF